MNVRAEFEKKFRVNELQLDKNHCWTLSIRPQQLTFGAAILSTNANYFSLSELSETHYLELRSLISAYEKVMRKNFSAVKFNYLCLMMVDPVVHFHVFPRFELDMAVGNISNLDPFYPKPIDVTTNEESVANADIAFKLIKQKF